MDSGQPATPLLASAIGLGRGTRPASSTCGNGLSAQLGLGADVADPIGATSIGEQIDGARLEAARLLKDHGSPETIDHHTKLHRIAAPQGSPGLFTCPMLQAPGLAGETNMDGRERSGWRTIGGLLLAVVTAPVATAACVDLMLLFTPPPASIGWVDALGGSLAFLLFAFVFGSVLALIPGLVLGAIVIAVARSCRTRSPAFYAAAGGVAGLCMAWVDTGRTHGAFTLRDALPFAVGGCLSALTYWSVAER